MGGKTTTSNTPNPPSQQELDYYASQADLTKKQLEILGSQTDYNQSYLDQTKPLLDAQMQLLQKQLDAENNPDPVQAEIASKSAALQLQNLNDASDLAPLQKQVLQAQLQSITDQNKGPTDQQIASIDAATKSAYDTGVSDINEFSNNALQQIRNNLAPGLGLRPTDTPIEDRGQLVAKEATRQAGQLATSLAGANASARLNYPLAVAGVNQAGADFTANLKAASDQFQAGLSDAAAANRARLVGTSSDIINSGTNAGIGLVTGSRGNPLSFASTGSSTTQTTSPGFFDYLSAAAGAAKAGAGIAASDARAKYNIVTVGHDNSGRRWVDFTYKGEPADVRHRGVIAQEVEKTDPEAVLTNGIGLKFVDYGKLKDKRAA